MGDMTRNFSRSEFACHCGCGYDAIDPALVEICQTIRTAVGEPVRITSGCRCKAHNARCGGVQNSYHTQGMAADLTCRSGSKMLFDAIAWLYTYGRLPRLTFAQRYVKKNFVHIDIGSAHTGLFVVK